MIDAPVRYRPDVEQLQADESATFAQLNAAFDRTPGIRRASSASTSGHASASGTGIAAHRPLGNINRARRNTYRHSADFRVRVNDCPYHEPVSGEG